MIGASGSSVERVDPHRYEFTSRWTVDCDPDEVYEVLSRLDEYEAWWPQVRRSERDADGRGLIHLRSALPFTLKLDMTRDVEDPRSRRLRARLGRDLEGTVEWAISESAAGSLVDFTQVVTLTHPFVRRVDRFLRRVLEWNHSVAMAGGAAGLRRALASEPAGTEVQRGARRRRNPH